MNTFAVGDKVSVVKDDEGMGAMIGAIGVIVDIDDHAPAHDPFIFKVSTDRYKLTTWFSSDELEKVT